MTDFLTNTFASQTCTEMVTFEFDVAKRVGKEYWNHKFNAVLYASPAMIQEAEVWIATQPRDQVKHQQLYEKLVELGAMRDGHNVWVEQTKLYHAGSYSTTKEIRETWIENRLDMRESVEPNKPGLREFFRDGSPDPDRPARAFIPLDGIGQKLSGIKVAPRPDTPERSLLDLPKL